MICPRSINDNRMDSGVGGCLWRLINNRAATKSYISEVDRDCQVCTDVYFYMREGVSLTYTIRAMHDGTSIKRESRALTEHRESLNMIITITPTRSQ